MKTILFLCNHAAFFVSHRLPIAIESKKYFNVKLIIGRPSSKSMELNAINKLKKHKIKYQRLKYKSFTYNLFLDIYGFLQIFFHIFKNKPKLIHLISPKCIIFGGIVCKILNVKSVVISISGLGSIMNIESNLIKKIYFNLLKFVFSNKNKKIIFHNNYDLLLFKKMFKLKKKDLLITYGSGVNFIEKKNKSHEKKIVIFPSRVLKDKGIIEFIEASKILKKKYSDWKFIVVGSIDYDSPMKYKIKNTDDFYKSVKFIGHKNNIKKYLNEASIVCLPSYREGMPKVLLEASALGKPIVTTNIPGCKDIVELCKNGILVKPKNSKSLYEGLEKLINNKNLRKKMKFNSYKNSRKYFDVNKVVDIHLKCYEQLFSNVRQ